MKIKRSKKLRPWRGDLVAAIYDTIMVRSVFPRKFRADYDKHCRIIETHLAEVHKKDILEVGTGSGFTAAYLAPDNRYSGSDISPGLMKRAEKRFARKGFKLEENASFYRAGAESLPFENGCFDYGICLLTLNFIDNTEKALEELNRVMRTGSTILFCVPCLERMETGVRIRGQLYTAEELKTLFCRAGFCFKIEPEENGALLYFTVQKSTG